MAYKNPADAAMPYLDQIPGTIKPYYNPYINAGKGALDTLTGQYDQLVKNPSAILASIGKNYQQSPGYGFNYNQSMNAANSAAASGGMLGTPAHQQEAATLASSLASQDYNDYISKALMAYFQGISGEQDLTHTGYGASNELANSLGNNLMNQGNMAYAGQQNQNQSQSDFWSSLIGLGTAAIPGIGGAIKGGMKGGIPGAFGGFFDAYS